MTSWLHRQRKQTLLDLSSEAGLQLDDHLRKDDIVDQLDTFLTANATRLSRNPSFAPYFAPRNTPAPPTNHATTLTSPDDASRQRSIATRTVQRATRVKQEEADPSYPSPVAASSPVDTAHRALAKFTTIPTLPSPSTQLTAAATRPTPGRLRLRQHTLPVSPADVADVAEHESSQLYANIADLYTLSPIPSTIASLRETCSSLAAVQLLILTLEFWALQRAVLGHWKLLADVPYWPGHRVALSCPDLFRLLEGGFWAPTGLWLAISLALPSLFAYFFNLTIRNVKRHGVKVSVARYTIDPLVFNVVKAILVYVVLGTTFGVDFVDQRAITVRDAFVGGYAGPLTGSAVVILAALYEAAQRK